MIVNQNNKSKIQYLIIVLYTTLFVLMHIIPHPKWIICKFIIAQWIVQTRRTLMWLTQASLVNKSFKFMVILRLKCLVCVYHNNHQLYHITIIDLYNWYITLSILLHITNSYLCSVHECMCVCVWVRVCACLCTRAETDIEFTVWISWS